MSSQTCVVCGTEIHSRVAVRVEVNFFSERPGAPDWNLGWARSWCHVGCWKARQNTERIAGPGTGEVLGSGDWVGRESREGDDGTAEDFIAGRECVLCGRFTSDRRRLGHIGLVCRAPGGRFEGAYRSGYVAELDCCGECWGECVETLRTATESMRGSRGRGWE